MTKTTTHAGVIAVATCLLLPAVPCHADIPPPPESPTPVRAYEYDAEGNVTKITRDPGGLNVQTRVGYDPQYRVKELTDPKNGKTAIEYDGGGRPTKVTDPRNLVTPYPRNGFGDATQLISRDTGITNITYDSARNLKTLPREVRPAGTDHGSLAVGEREGRREHGADRDDGEVWLHAGPHEQPRLPVGGAAHDDPHGPERQRAEPVSSHGRRAHPAGPLMLAAIGGHADAMRYLVSRGANVNARHRPSGADLLMLLVASPKGFSEEALNFLLQQGLSPNYSTPSGETALQFATEMKNEVAVVRLLDAGAVPTASALQVVDAASYPDTVIRQRVRAAASRTVGSR